jgi:hypothetical protein
VDQSGNVGFFDFSGGESSGKSIGVAREIDSQQGCSPAGLKSDIYQERRSAEKAPISTY